MSSLAKWMIGTLSVWLVIPTVIFVAVSLALGKPGAAGALLALWGAGFFGGTGGVLYALWDRGADTFESAMVGALAGILVAASPIAINFL